ncbi:MAG: hypothetical protein AVDCRST_MAG56-7199, partial [uncultured Cytophagales bacterium]
GHLRPQRWTGFRSTAGNASGGWVCAISKNQPRADPLGGSNSAAYGFRAAPQRERVGECTYASCIRLFTGCPYFLLVHSGLRFSSVPRVFRDGPPYYIPHLSV